MEGDSIRVIGENTLVDVWIAGKVRSVSVTKAAIAAFLEVPDHEADMLTEERRKEFMRTHLSRVVAVAQKRLIGMDPATECVTIDSVTTSPPAPTGGDRRQGDRRKGERRKLNLGPPPTGERRKGSTRRS